MNHSKGTLTACFDRSYEPNSPKNAIGPLNFYSLEYYDQMVTSLGDKIIWDVVQN